MDLEPPTQPVARPRSTRSRHGSTSKAQVRRPPSPDSACEHDAEWVGCATSGQEEMTSDLSEESSDNARNVLPRKSGPSMRRKSDSALVKGGAGQDSDVDSGIVACGKPGQRIGSTSSADTDSSQESRRRIEYSPPFPKSELSKSRSSSGSLRVAKHSSLTETSGPIKGDHLALKECNRYRRPPTPLTVFPESNHCVRFDEQLQLSEQNIRRSCRKLFATLYAQRFSYPARPNSCLPPGRNSTPGSVRVRSRTAPELELRRYSPISVDGSSRYGKNYKQSPVVGRRGETIAWSNRSLQKSTSDVNLIGKVLHPQQTQQQKFQVHKYPMETIENRQHNPILKDNFQNNSQCTCLTRQTSAPVSSSQPPTCTCRCCNCSQQPARTTGLFKSSSCSTLSSVLSHQSRPQLTQFPQRNLKKPVTQAESADAKLQKTSSCSSLLDNRNLQVSKVPVYSDNMVHVYARIASVVPEEVKSPSQGGRRAKALHKMKQSSENIYDAIRPSSASTLSTKSDSVRIDSGSEKMNILAAEVSKDLESLRTARENYNSSISKMSCDSDVKSTSSDIYSQVGEIGNISVSSNKSLREKNPNRTYNPRPKSVGVVIPSPVYLKSALKKPTQSAMQNVNESVNGHLVEVEYAVVDKSKKNRFASLPALNGCNGNINNMENEDKDHPPVPPKKHLHKSDFSLYRSRSSSPKKSLLERMHTLTRNAKSALQKAFSTERIYRPEREERIEASGQKTLQRSRSFIKGITGSFRRKKRKPKNVMAEVVTKASSNPEWDESPCGPNSPIHVRGQLLQLNLDGSQVVELTKPPSKPYGFFVARGRVRNSKGVFVSRMRDQDTQRRLEGLLDIGDEILEIDGFNVKDADIMEVNSLMSNKSTLLLTVLPYICRRDI